METTFKKCSRCSVVQPRTAFTKRAASHDGLSAACKDCIRIYERSRLHDPKRVETRKQINANLTPDKRREYSQRYWNCHPLKRAAHMAVWSALKSGRFVKMPCEQCGAPKAQAHHDDYTAPLDVRWLCTRCHAEHHRNERLASVPSVVEKHTQ